MARTIFFVILTAVVMFAAPAMAQSTNATPILVTSTKPLDPASLTLDDSGKQTVTGYLASAKASTTAMSVLAASADLKLVTYYTLATGLSADLSDTARVALELCEYDSKAPCLILSINGNDAREPTGGWPVQPQMLVSQTGLTFDARTMPFQTASLRADAATLSTLAKPSAIVVTTAGTWFQASGAKDVFDAVAQAGAACRKAYPAFPCILYAVDNIVVMAP